MTRRIIQNKEEPSTYNQLARIEDVSEEELRKKYMEDVDHKDQDKSDEEIRIEEEQMAAMEMMSFLGIEGVELDMNDNPLKQLTDMCAAGVKEQMDKNAEDPEYQKMINDLRDVEVLDMNEINNDRSYADRLLITSFQEKQEKMAEEMEARKRRRKAAKKSVDGFMEAEAEVIEDNYARTGTDSGYRSSSSVFGGTSSASASTTASASSSYSSSSYSSKSTDAETTSFKREKSEAELAAAKQKRDKYLFQMNDRMMEMAMNETGRAPKQKKQKTYGKRKFSFKSMWNSAKEWVQSKEAAVFKNIAAMLALQTGMLMVTKKLEFEGPMQALGYMAMGVGSFYFARELRALGLDPRKMAF